MIIEGTTVAAVNAQRLQKVGTRDNQSIRFKADAGGAAANTLREKELKEKVVDLAKEQAFLSKKLNRGPFTILSAI